MTRQALGSFTDAELIYELLRRFVGKPAEPPEEWCEDCIHFKVWTKAKDPPNDYNPCGRRHATEFWMPVGMDPHAPGGFFRKHCTDYHMAGEERDA